MQKKKHILIILGLIAVMAFGISAAAVYAEASNEYYYRVGPDPSHLLDPDVDNDKQEEGWKYDCDTKTLTLNGIGSDKNAPPIAFAGFDLTIDLQNDNTLSFIQQTNYSVDPNGPRYTLAITGTDSRDRLSINPEVPESCIFADIVQIKGGTLNLSSFNSTPYQMGISARENVEILGTSEVTPNVTIATTGGDGIYSFSKVIVKGGALNITSAEGNGICAAGGGEVEISGTPKITIDAEKGKAIGAAITDIRGGTVKLTGARGIGPAEDGDSRPAVNMAGGDVTIIAQNHGIDVGSAYIEAGALNITSAAAQGIFCNRIYIKGTAMVTVAVGEDGSDGIRADVAFTLSDKANVTAFSGPEGAAINSKEITIKSGSLNVTQGYSGIGYFSEGFKQGSVSIAGGKVSINCPFEGIYTGDIIIKGGDVNVTSKMGYAIEAANSVAMSGKNTRVEAMGGIFEDSAPEIAAENPGISARTITISNPLAIITPEGGKIFGDEYQVIADKNGTPARHVIIYAKDYKITVQKPTNGTAKANKQKAKAGETVTVTAKPAKGYTVNKMTYTNAAGKVTKIASSGKFKMPASDVTVKVTFKKKPAVNPSGVLLATATSAGDTSIAVTWTKMKNVDGYDMFFAKCNIRHKDYPVKKVATIKGNKTFKWKKTGLKKGKPYKICVKAYVMKNGKKKYIKSSPLSHAYTSTGSKHYTNATSVTVDKDTLSLKKGKSSQLDPKVQKLKAKKELMSKNHEPKLRYLSSNKKIASVSSKGKIKAVAKGTCYIYAYAHNGVYKKIKVTVK